MSFYPNSHANVLSDAHRDVREGGPEPVLKLWRHVFGGTRGLLAIWTGQRDANGKIPEGTAKTRFFNYPTEAKDAAQWSLGESDRGREAYFCAHLLSRRRRIKKNAQEVHTLWGDLDGAQVPDGDLAPSAVVESSTGRFHCYWRLADPIPPQDAEVLNKRLARKIGADSTGFDLTQLLRVPQTTNHKYEDHPIVGVRRLVASRTYSVADVDRMLPPAKPEKTEFTNGHRSRVRGAKPGAERQDAEILRLLMNAANGADSKEVYAGGGEFPSPSERDQSLANRIAFYTQDADQVERIMRTSGCVRKKWDEHRTYLKRTIGKAIDGLTNTYGKGEVAEIPTLKKTQQAAGVRDLRRRWRDHDWGQVVGTANKPNWMRGHTCRDVFKALIDQAEKHGTVADDGEE